MSFKLIEIGESTLKIADGNYSSKYPRSEDFVNEGIPFIRANNLTNKKVIDTDMYYITTKKHSELKKGHLKAKDVLITTRGNIGQVAIVPERHDGSNINAQIVLLRCDENWCPEYLLYSLSSEFVLRQIPPLTTGTALKQLPVKNLKKLKIPLPPLTTQKRIAQILDNAAALRDKTQQLITEYDQLAQSIFLDMFGDPVINPMGWKKRKGLNYYDVKGRVGWKGYKKTDLREEGPIVLGATHIDKFGNIDITKSVHLTREKFLESPEIFIEKNDLIFVQRGNTIGKVGIVNFEIGEATINPVVLILRATGDNNPYFLLHLLMNENLKKEVIDLNSGSAQPMITQKSIKEYNIIDVPTKLQIQFADKIRLIEQQKALAKQELQHSEDLFNCLLQKAFKGELV